LLLISDSVGCSSYFHGSKRIDSAGSELLGYDGRKLFVQVVP
jgi:hypothetical protein